MVKGKSLGCGCRLDCEGPRAPWSGTGLHWAGRRSVQGKGHRVMVKACIKSTLAAAGRGWNGREKGSKQLTSYYAPSRITLYEEKWNTAGEISKKRGTNAHVKGFHIKAQ